MMHFRIALVLLAAAILLLQSEATTIPPPDYKDNAYVLPYPSYRQVDDSFKCAGFPGLSQRDSDKCLVAMSITQPLESGDGFRLWGRVTSDPSRIVINFIKGDSERPAIALHLSIRFKEGKIVYNRYQRGWSTYEQHIPHDFKANEELDLRVRIFNSQYIVSGNGDELGTFKPIMSLDGVDHVSISGDLKWPFFMYGMAA